MVKKTITLFIFITLVLSGIHAEDLFPETGFRFKNRTVELGLNANVGFNNSLFTVGELFKEKVYLDIDSLDGFKINADLFITPFFLRFNYKDKWGFALSANVETAGNIELSKNLMNLKEAIDEKSKLGFAAFADISLDLFFNIQNYKIKIRPSVFYTVAYAKPELRYTFITGGASVLNLEYDARIYTAFEIKDIDNIHFSMDSITAKPGVDFSLGVEYPISRALGWYEKSSILDFDIGLDLLNIPVTPSSMRHYVHFAGNMSLKGDTIKEFFDSFNTKDFFKDPSYGEEKISIRRPFRGILHVNWRPFGSRLLTITPNGGISINPMYEASYIPEFGLKIKLDLANIFMLTAGVNYEDLFWKNRVDIALNLRVLELNIAAEARTNKIFRFNDISGVGIYAGVKIGF